MTVKVCIRIWSLIIVLFSLGAVCSAQQKPSFAGIKSGISIPFGQYGDTSLEGGSFTQPGFNVTLEGAWFFTPVFGVGISTGLNLHPVNVATLGRERVNSDPFLNNVVIRSEPYRIITGMGGLFVQYPAIPNLSITGKITCGLLYGMTPYQLYKPDYYLLPNTYQEITSAQAWKFSWQAGAGFRYDVSPCIGLVLESEILIDELEFGFQTNTGRRIDRKQIAFINLSGGIRLKL